jgi:hypothetical protein
LTSVTGELQSAALPLTTLRACLVSFKRYFKSVTFSYTKMKIF